MTRLVFDPAGSRILIRAMAFSQRNALRRSDRFGHEPPLAP